MQVIAGLRAENQSHHWGRPDDPSTLRTKERLKELFCPASPAWRKATLASGIDLVNKSIACLSAAASGNPVRGSFP
jgi:hypothetical protein